MVRMIKGRTNLANDTLKYTTNCEMMKGLSCRQHVLKIRLTVACLLCEVLLLFLIGSLAPSSLDL